ncbi:MAG: hypothetical protein JSS60_07175 [Verrucomicrobia bacterium]|nr:hypothetical protein [Verrucomicrobiota bacterium]
MKKLPLKLSHASLWFLLAAAPIPFFLFLFNFMFGMQKLDQLEEEMERIHTRASQMQEIQSKENVLLASLKNPDPLYLEKNVESLTFLLSEVKKFEAIQSENAEDEQIGKRLQFLKEGGNRLVFSEEQIRTNEIFREIEEKQQHPVEMNEEDLKKLLCLIEGTTIWPYGPKEGRPQLIIKDFKLSKKEISSQDKVFVVSMQLIKRENLEPSR